MSIVSSRSSRSGGSGTIIRPTIATTAPGAIRCVARRLRLTGDATAGTGVAMSEHQLLQADEVREDLGHRLEQRAGDHVANLRFGVERARERDVLDHRDAVLSRDG